MMECLIHHTVENDNSMFVTVAQLNLLDVLLATCCLTWASMCRPSISTTSFEQELSRVLIWHRQYIE